MVLPTSLVSAVSLLVKIVVQCTSLGRYVGTNGPRTLLLISRKYSNALQAPPPDPHPFASLDPHAAATALCRFHDWQEWCRLPGAVCRSEHDRLRVPCSELDHGSMMSCAHKLRHDWRCPNAQGPMPTRDRVRGSGGGDPPDVRHVVLKHPADGADVEAVVGVVHDARVGGQARLPGQL